MNIVMTQINPSENKETKHAKPEKIMKLDQEAANPCLKEHLLSLKCIENNYYEQKRCEPYFENYKLCKGFWKNVAAERMRKGIEPALPLPQERDAVKADFLKTYQPYGCSHAFNVNEEKKWTSKVYQGKENFE